MGVSLRIRSAVDHILAFNRRFPRERLRGKLDKISSSPFALFRGTFHLFAYDIREGWCHDWPLAAVEGPIIGDLHVENFGAYRAVSSDIVYDINDFDEVTEAPYEIDLRRLLTSILLAALDNGHSFGSGVRDAELAARSYLETLGRLAEMRARKKFESLTDTQEILNLVPRSREKPRVQFLKKLAVETAPGNFALRQTDRMMAVDTKVRERAREAIPDFLAHVLAPPKARPMGYTFQDIAFRISGVGSLGRARYALLFGKGRTEREQWHTLRVIEWKESIASALDSRRSRPRKHRGQEVFMFARSFQLFAKRYLGFLTMDGQPMQTKEIGANDARFDPKSMREPIHFQRAAEIFGKITARAHLLGSIGTSGPRPFVKQLQGREDRYVHKLLSFVVAYADRTFEDFDEVIRRKQEIAQDWRMRKPGKSR